MEIEFYNVSYNYRLRNVSCKFSSSNVTSIIGKSGSGKSLMGYLIMGLEVPTNGYVTIDGKRNYDLFTLRKEIGYVFQNPLLHIFCDTVYDEICFGLKQYRFKIDKIDSQVSKALKMVGLDDSYLKLNPRYLSSGEIERVAIASSLVLNPKVLILDEPTVYLDNSGVMDLVGLIRMLRDKYGKSIIVMSNDMDFVSEISDNYILIDEGKVINYGNNIDMINNSDTFIRYGMEVSSINRFIRLCNRRGVNIGYTNDIDELVEMVMDNV